MMQPAFANSSMNGNVVACFKKSILHIRCSTPLLSSFSVNAMDAPSQYNNSLSMKVLFSHDRSGNSLPLRSKHSRLKKALTRQRMDTNVSCKKHSGRWTLQNISMLSLHLKETFCANSQKKQRYLTSLREFAQNVSF